MAKKTATVGQWIGNRRRFANVFNVKIFDGAQVIKPEELEPIEGETHIFFKNVDVDTGMAISSFMNSKSIMNEIDSLNEGGRVDMCKALEDWAAEERAEGREENLVNLICKKLAKGKDIATIADEVEETEEVVKQLMEKHNLKA